MPTTVGVSGKNSRRTDDGSSISSVMITFRYKLESTGAHGKTIKRPVADVFLKTTNGTWIEFHPYIDSGADVTLIPLSLGKLIGLTSDEKNIEQIGGIRGSVPVMYGKREIKIGSSMFSVIVAWALIEHVPPLLGRTDIFDHFDITFQQTRGTIIFQEHGTHHTFS